MKTLLITLLLSISIFGQSELLLLMGDDSYTPPAGFEFFIDADGKKVMTDQGEYILVRKISQYSSLTFNQYLDFVILERERNEKTNFIH